MADSPNMIGEQVIELRDGLSSFQEKAFESLYDKKVGWLSSQSKSIPAVNSGEGLKGESTAGGTTVLVAPPPLTQAAVDTKPVASETIAVVTVKPIITADRTAAKDGIAVRDVQVRPTPEVDDERAAEMRKLSIIKAQQAVTQSFLSLAKSSPVSDVQTSPTPPTAVGNFFGFLKSSDAEQKGTSSKTTVTPPTTPIIFETKSKASVTVNDGVVKSPQIDTSKILPTAIVNSPSDGFFGFLKKGTSNVQSPSLNALKSSRVIETKVEPTVEVESEEVKAGGYFGFLTAGSDTVPLATKPATITASKAAPVNVRSLNEIQSETVKKNTEAAPKITPLSTLFGFIQSPPAPTPIKLATPKVEEKVATPTVPLKKEVAVNSAPTGGMFGFLKPKAAEQTVVEKVIPTAAIIKTAPPVSKGKIPPVPQVPSAAPIPVPVAEVASGGGFFGFLGKSKVGEAAVKVPKVQKEQAVAMNTKFQSAVSKLLKGDSTKIKSFQRATDSFRSGGVSGDAFLLGLEELFGAVALESVVLPLVSELPEREMAVKLQSAYDKKVAELVKASAPQKKSFSFGLFDRAPAKTVTPPPAVVIPVVSVPDKKSVALGSSKLKSLTPAPSVAVKAVPFRVPAKVPIGKKVSIEKQMKALLAGSTDPETFLASITKELGKPKMAEVILDIVSVFPADIGSKVEALYRSSK